MVTIIKRIINWFYYEDKEIFFLNKSYDKVKKGVVEKKIVIQFQSEVEFIERFYNFSKEFKSYTVLLNIPKVIYSIYDYIFFPLIIFKIIEQFFLIKKTTRLNNRLFESEIITPKYGFINFIKYLPKSVKLFWNLKSKKDFYKITHKEIVIGDLLYDTYLRYYKKATLNLNDINLVVLFAKTFYEIEFLEKFSKNIDIYLTGHCTYTVSGLPVRVFLKKNVEVYSFSNFKNEKKLSLEDYLQVKPHWYYKSKFSLLQEKEVKIQQGLNLIKNRMRGHLDLSYMRHNPYGTDNLKSEYIKSFDGVMFLHDFTDSYHIYRNIVFSDFFEWTEITFELIIKNNLNIGIKPHPNQNTTSKKITNGLIKKYKDLNWINDSISNNTIFSSGISFGISVYGTVLTELAFNKIIPISCGDNPTSNYGFTFNAKTIQEYSDLILNYKDLNFNGEIENEIGEFMYMHYIIDKI
ncbi:hypothetical protein N8873_01115 [Flavobacteriaceae bacterium]|nr:hypothetical protein [Flavobacteriaceae bacterium]